DDQLVGGIVEDPRSRAASLAGGAGLGVAHVPDDVVVNLVGVGGHLHVDARADRHDVGEHVARHAAVGVADVEPDRVGVPHVAHHVAAEEQTAGVVELGPGRFPAAFGVGPAAPLAEVVFDEGVARAHATDAFDPAAANRI